MEEVFTPEFIQTTLKQLPGVAVLGYLFWRQLQQNTANITALIATVKDLVNEMHLMGMRIQAVELRLPPPPPAPVQISSAVPFPATPAVPAGSHNTATGEGS